MPRNRRRTRHLFATLLALTLALSACFSTEEGLMIVTPGLRTVPLASPEGLAVLASYQLGAHLAVAEFGPLTGSILVAMATQYGYSVVDLVTGASLYDEDESTRAPMFGVLGLSEDPSGGDSDASLVGFGTSGVTVSPYTGGSGAFGMSVGYGSSVTYDMFPAAGDIHAAIVTKVQPSIGVRFLVNDFGPGLPQGAFDATVAPDEADLAPAAWEVSTEVLPAANFSGELVSAFLADDNLDDPAPVLVLDRAVSSGLYLDDRDGDAPIRALEVGLDARKLRCIDTEAGSGYLCAISVFGQDQLAIVNWDGETVPVWRGYVDVGDGPVGIELRRLDDGNIAVVSTGFNDNSVTEVKLSNSGTLLDTSQRSAPAGCTAPGHAVYFEDDGGLGIVATCWESGNYFVQRSEL